MNPDTASPLNPAAPYPSPIRMSSAALDDGSNAISSPSPLSTTPSKYAEIDTGHTDAPRAGIPDYQMASFAGAVAAQAAQPNGKGFNKGFYKGGQKSKAKLTCALAAGGKPRNPARKSSSSSSSTRYNNVGTGVDGGGGDGGGVSGGSGRFRANGAGTDGWDHNDRNLPLVEVSNSFFRSDVESLSLIDLYTQRSQIMDCIVKLVSDVTHRKRREHSADEIDGVIAACRSLDRSAKEMMAAMTKEQPGMYDVYTTHMRWFLCLMGCSRNS